MFEESRKIDTADELLAFLKTIPPVLLSSMPVSVVVSDMDVFESVRVDAFYVQDTEKCWASGLCFSVNDENSPVEKD